MILELGSHKIEFFDSIDSLPFKRMNEFNKYIMLDSHLGGSVQDFDKVLQKTFKFLESKMHQEAYGELLNLRQVYHNIMNGTSIKGLAFACMIKKVDLEEITDYSIEYLNQLLTKLDGWGMLGVHVNSTLEDLKKK
jgi:hypothetical protein